MRWDGDTTYLGNQESTDLTTNRLTELGFAYPFPTLQGSLVFAASYHRLVPLDTNYLRSGVGFPGGTGDGIVSETESVDESGVIGAWQAGLALDFSREVSLGVSATILSGQYDRQRNFDFTADDCVVDGVVVPCRDTQIYHANADYSGYTGALGVLYKGDSGVRAAVTVQLPQHYEIDGKGSEDVYWRTLEDTPEVLEDIIQDFKIVDELDIPIQLTGGASWESRELTASGQVTLTNWNDLESFDGTVRLSDGEFAYRSTVAFRVGAEYRFLGTPLALRAGFALEPVAYDFITTDAFQGIQSRPTSEDTQKYFTGGFGYALDPSVHLDFAFMRGSGSRTGRIVEAGDVRTTTEETTETRILAGVTFYQTR